MQGVKIKNFFYYGNLVTNVLLFGFLPFFILYLNYKNTKGNIIEHLENNIDINSDNLLLTTNRTFSIDWTYVLCYLVLCILLVLIIFFVRTITMNKIFLIFILEISLFIRVYDSTLTFWLATLIHFNVILLIFLLYYRETKNKFSIKSHFIFIVINSIILLILTVYEKVYFNIDNTLNEYFNRDTSVHTINLIKDFTIINSFYFTYQFLFSLIILVTSAALIFKLINKHDSLFEIFNISYVKSIIINLFIILFLVFEIVTGYSIL